jgi:pseudouridine synthase
MLWCAILLQVNRKFKMGQSRRNELFRVGLSLVNGKQGKPLMPLSHLLKKKPGDSHQHLVFHKPYGVLSKFTDAEDRPTLAAYISMPHVYPAGRLDMDSEGLLLLTSDGNLATRLTSPSYKVPKTYLVQIERIPDEAALVHLRRGVLVKGRQTRPATVHLLSQEPMVHARPTADRCFCEIRRLQFRPTKQPSRPSLRRR